MTFEDRLTKLEQQVAELEAKLRELLADPIAAETRRLNAEARKAAEEVRGKIIKE